jgi:hypothetical protein
MKSRPVQGRAGDINLRALLVYGCGRAKKTTASFRDALFCRDEGCLGGVRLGGREYGGDAA